MAEPIKDIDLVDFKGLCTRLIDEVRRTGMPVTISDGGKPIAIISAAPPQEEKPAAAKPADESLKITPFRFNEASGAYTAPFDGFQKL